MCKLQTGMLVMLTAGPAVEQGWGMTQNNNLVILSGPAREGGRARGNKGSLYPTARPGAVAGWCQGKKISWTFPLLCYPRLIDPVSKMRRSCSEERLYSLLIHLLWLVQWTQEPLSEFSSGLGVGNVVGEQAQHPGHASAGFVCSGHSPSGPASPLLFALSPIQPIRNISECCHWMMQRGGMCWAGQSFLLGLRRNQCRNSAGSGMQWRWAGEQPFYTLSIWLSLVSWRKYRSC